MGKLVENLEDSFETGLIGLYGPPNCGKSLSSLGLIEEVTRRYGKKALYWDQERARVGLRSVSRRLELPINWYSSGVKEKFSKKTGKMLKLSSDPIDDAIEFAEFACSGEYSIVLLDTISTIAKLLFRSTVEKDLSDGKTTQRVRVLTKAETRINHGSIQDYGVFASVFDDFMRRIWTAIEMGVFVVLIGHEKVVGLKDDDDDGGEDLFGTIDAPGKIVPRGLPGLMMLMLRMKLVKEKKKDKDGVRRVRRIWFPDSPDPIWKAKDRLGVLNVDGEDVTVDKRKYKDEEDFKDAIVETNRSMWEDWLVALERETGFVGEEKKKKKKVRLE